MANKTEKPTEKQKQTISPEEKKRLSRKRRSNIGVMLLCLLAAFGFWCYVMNVDSPIYEETFSSVSLQVSNNNNAVAGTVQNDTASQYTAISASDGSIVEVTLRGRRSVLSDLSDEDITAYVDISSVTQAGRQAFPVVVEAPAGTTVVDYSPREMTVYVDRRGSKQVDVVVRKDYPSMPAGYYFGEETLSDPTIVVTGPQSELDMVAAARLVLSRSTEITGSYTGAGELELIDASGNVINSSYLHMSTTHVSCTVTVCTEKQLPLTTTFKNGYWTNADANVTITPDHVTVRGPVETLASLTSLEVTTLDETTVLENRTYNYGLRLPEGVELSQTLDNVQVSVSLRNSYSRTLDVSGDQISVTNTPSNATVTIPEQTVRVTVRGNSEQAVNDLAAENIRIQVDLSAANNLSPGRQMVNATVSIASGNSAAAYVLGTYQVAINVQ